MTRMNIKRVFVFPNKRKKLSPDHKSDNLVQTTKSTDESIPIPGVKKLVLTYQNEQRQHETDRFFSRPVDYIKQVKNEVSYALFRRSANYDMDDEDEEWLMEFNRDGICLSDENFELIVDVFEKTVFCCPEEFNKSGETKAATAAAAAASCLCSEDVAVAVYGYWFKKRKRRKSALVRVFEANKVKKRRGRKKKSELRTASITVKPSATEDAVEDEEHDDMKKQLTAAEEEARKLGDLAVKKRNEAQLIMTNANFLMLKAQIALKIAQVAQFKALEVSVTGVY